MHDDPQANEPEAPADLHIVFGIGGQRYALPHTHVVEMVQPPTAVPLPHAPDAVLGVINLRGTVMGLVDMRAALGLTSAAEENNALVSALVEREREHRDWLAELERSVLEEREFRMTTDPHACAFGRWFDGFRSANIVLEQTVSRFGKPHARIHAIAIQARKLVEAGQRDAALALINETRHGDLALMIRLFAETREALASLQREIAIIVRTAVGSTLAILVDTVDSIETLEPQPEADLGAVSAGSSAAAMVCGVASRADEELVLLVDPDAMLDVLGPAVSKVA